MLVSCKWDFFGVETSALGNQMNARPRSKFEVNWWVGVGRSAVEFKAVVQVLSCVT